MGTSAAHTLRTGDAPGRVTTPGPTSGAGSSRALSRAPANGASSAFSDAGAGLWPLGTAAYLTLRLLTLAKRTGE